MKDFTLENLQKLSIQFDVVGIYLFLIVAFAILYLLAKKRVNFSLRTLVALGLGLLSGIVLKYILDIDQAKITYHMQPYVKALRYLFSAIVIPLIATSIIKSFTSLNDTLQLKRIGLKSLYWLLGTTAVATVIGIVVATVANIGTNFPTIGGDPSKAKVIPQLYDVLLSFLPSNFIQDMASNKVIPVIVMAILISVAVTIEGARHPERVKPFKDFINSFSEVMVRVTKLILKVVPYAVFAIMVNATVRDGLNTLSSLLVFILVVYLAMFIHLVVVQLGLITYVAKLNPIRYINKIAPTQLFAFTTQSSYATLPVTINSLTKRVGVSERIAGFVAPLGANVGMNACGGLFPAMVAIFVANAYDVQLTFAHYAILIVTTTVASIGVAGVPGIATLTTTVVLTSLGLPLEGISLVAGVDALIDMGRTAINVTGTSVTATLVAVSEKEFDHNIFNSDIDESIKSVESL